MSNINYDKLPPEIQQMIAGYMQQEGASEAGEVSPTEMQQMIGQIYFFLKDDVSQKYIWEDTRLRSLVLGFSHLIRTSRLDDERKRAEMKLRWRRAVRLQLLILSEKVTMDDLALFDLLVNFGYTVIEDQNQGWRGKLAAERVKTYKIEGATPKRRGGILSWLGLR